MQIVWNDEIKDALKMVCECTDKYNVDITVHFWVDGDVEVSVTPTYRDKFDPSGQTDCQWR